LLWGVFFLKILCCHETLINFPATSRTRRKLKWLKRLLRKEKEEEEGISPLAFLAIKDFSIDRAIPSLGLTGPYRLDGEKPIGQAYSGNPQTYFEKEYIPVDILTLFTLLDSKLTKEDIAEIIAQINALTDKSGNLSERDIMLAIERSLNGNAERVKRKTEEFLEFCKRSLNAEELQFKKVSEFAFLCMARR